MLPFSYTLGLVLALLLLLSNMSAVMAFNNKALGVGENFYNSVQRDGKVYSWGSYHGIGLGKYSESHYSFPMLMPNVNTAKDVSAGAYHTCITLSDGSVKCTGENKLGQLGMGATKTDFFPVEVLLLPGSRVKQVVSGFSHTCAQLESGGMQCWGNNADGQLASGRAAQALGFSPQPLFVSRFESSGVLTAAAGGYHTCIVTTTRGGGNVFCAGRNNAGQLGDGTTTARAEMTPVQGLSGVVVQIACHAVHTCAVTAAGQVYCWGSNDSFQLGRGADLTQSLVPITPTSLVSGNPPAQGTSTVSEVQCGHGMTCVLFAGSRSAQCFGRTNQYGQLGNGNVTLAASPEPIDFGQRKTRIRELRIGLHTICALDLDGGVECAGFNELGQLGSNQLTAHFTALVRVNDLPLAESRCKLQQGLTKSACLQQARTCKTLKTVLQWTGPGCKINGVRQNDGGCRCNNYCGFTCKTACNKNSKCKWDASKQVCNAKVAGSFIHPERGYCLEHAVTNYHSVQ